MTKYPTKKIGEVCEVVGGGTPKTSVSSYWSGDIVWVTPKDLGRLNQSGIFDSGKKITSQGLKKSSAKLLPEGAVVLSSRAPIGYVAIATIPLATNQGCRSFICDESRLFNRYLYHFLLTQTAYLNSLGGGSTFREISGSKLKEVEIPIPPIEVQKKIVAQLESLLAKVSEAKKLRAEARESADNLLSAELHKVFTEGKKKGWEEKEFGDVVEVKTTRNTRDDLPYVGMEDVVGGNWNFLGSLEPKKVKSTTFYFDDQCLLYGKLRPYLNKVLLPTFEGHCTTEFMPIYPDKYLQREWLAWWLSSKEIVDHASATSTGSRMPRADLKQVLKFKLPVPPLTEQNKIVAHLDSIYQKIQALKDLQNTTENEFGVLESSILSKAFSGELVEEKAVAQQPTPSPIKIFSIQQAIGVTFQRGFVRGEMALAKVLYISQELFDVPLAIPFTPQNFGPYDTSVKKALTAGLSRRNRFFKKRGQVYVLGDGSVKLLQYTNAKIVKQMNQALDNLLPIIKNADSTSIERLATVCKIVQDIKSTDEDKVIVEMRKWKGDKFTDDQIKRSLQFIISKGWDKKLMIE